MKWRNPFASEHSQVEMERQAHTRAQLEEFMGALADMTLQARKYELELQTWKERAEFWKSKAEQPSGEQAALNLARAAQMQDDDDADGLKPVPSAYRNGWFKRHNEVFGNGLSDEALAALHASKKESDAG